jgi:hypothetical protein
MPRVASSKEIPSPKIPNKGLSALNCPVRFGSLEFENSLELGAWGLEFPP